MTLASSAAKGLPLMVVLLCGAAMAQGDSASPGDGFALWPTPLDGGAAVGAPAWPMARAVARLRDNPKATELDERERKAWELAALPAAKFVALPAPAMREALAELIRSTSTASPVDAAVLGRYRVLAHVDRVLSGEVRPSKVIPLSGAYGQLCNLELDDAGALTTAKALRAWANTFDVLQALDEDSDQLQKAQLALEAATAALFKTRPAFDAAFDAWLRREVLAGRLTWTRPPTPTAELVARSHRRLSNPLLRDGVVHFLSWEGAGFKRDLERLEKNGKRTVLAKRLDMTGRFFSTWGTGFAWVDGNGGLVSLPEGASAPKPEISFQRYTIDGVLMGKTAHLLMLRLRAEAPPSPDASWVLVRWVPGTNEVVDLARGLGTPWLAGGVDEVAVVRAPQRLVLVDVTGRLPPREVGLRGLRLSWKSAHAPADDRLIFIAGEDTAEAQLFWLDTTRGVLERFAEVPGVGLLEHSNRVLLTRRVQGETELLLPATAGGFQPVGTWSGNIDSALVSDGLVLVGSYDKLLQWGSLSRVLMKKQPE